jgi:hypothetical protein
MKGEIMSLSSDQMVETLVDCIIELKLSDYEHRSREQIMMEVHHGITRDQEVHDIMLALANKFYEMGRHRGQYEAENPAIE